MSKTPKSPAKELPTFTGPRTRLETGSPDRTRLTRLVAQHYRSGLPIRVIAERMGRSYGFVHRLLVESGTPMRARGGAIRKAA